jgi:hypothetical protein
MYEDRHTFKRSNSQHEFDFPLTLGPSAVLTNPLDFNETNHLGVGVTVGTSHGGHSNAPAPENYFLTQDTHVLPNHHPLIEKSYSTPFPFSSLAAVNPVD